MTLGPMMISARIDQDQIISKDLSLWNQQGSQVLRGQVLVLPVDNTFLYVEPIYLQASEARMPQLKKVVLVLDDRVIYTDTYEEALKQLAGPSSAGPSSTQTTQTTTTATPPPPPPGGADLARSIRDHIRRYKELVSQGRMAEAGKELEAIEAAVK